MLTFVRYTSCRRTERRRVYVRLRRLSLFHSCSRDVPPSCPLGRSLLVFSGPLLASANECRRDTGRPVGVPYRNVMSPIATRRDLYRDDD